MPRDEQGNPHGAHRNQPVIGDVPASTVVSVLRDRQSVAGEGLRPFVVEHLLSAVESPASFHSDDVLAALRNFRLSVAAITDLYIPAVARLLGQRWVDDKITFADVTIGSMRLQSLLSEPSVMVRPDHHKGLHLLNALVLVPQGEQHFLGASVLSGQLTRMGCDVSMSFHENFSALTANLMRDVPDLVLITCAREETLEIVAQTVDLIRNTVPLGPVIAIGGAVCMEQSDLTELDGVDIVTSFAEEAVAYCSRYLSLKRSS